MLVGVAQVILETMRNTCLFWDDSFSLREKVPEGRKGTAKAGKLFSNRQQWSF